MTTFTRLTILGTTRRCEVSVPRDEPIVSVFAQVLDLVREPAETTGRPLAVVTDLGAQVDLERTPAALRLTDGQHLRLMREPHLPPAPEVSDVTDVVGLEHDRRTDLWSDRSRRRFGAVALSLLGAGTGWLLTDVVHALIVVLSLVALAVLAGSLTDVAQGRRVALTLTAVSIGVGVVAAIGITGPSPADLPADLLGVHAAVWLAVWVPIGLGVGVGTGRAGAVAGGVVGSLLAAVSTLSRDAPPEQPAALAVLAAVVVGGALPRLAVTVSGLSSLDDRTLAGRLCPGPEVEESSAAAYDAMNWLSAATATAVLVPIGILLASTDPWAVALGVAALGVTALRTRDCPLVPQRAAGWLAVAGALIIGLLGQPHLSPGVSAAGLAALAALVVLATEARPPDHRRAWLRRAANIADLVAVLSLAPLALGLFGVFADLLGALR